MALQSRLNARAALAAAVAVVLTEVIPPTLEALQRRTGYRAAGV
jgi:hypothetical protein